VDGRRRHQAGLHHGETDDFCYNVVANPVHVHDLQATILHCLGVDHLKADVQVPGPALPYLYLCDTARGLVVKTTLDGDEVFTLGYPSEADVYRPNPDGSKKKYSPTNLAIAPNGDIYVGDGYGSSYINVYDKNGKYLKSFGGLGKEAGQLDCPHGIILDSRGGTPILLIADRGNNRIQSFNLAGRAPRFLQRDQSAVLLRLLEVR
jgi:hypothetical protein